MSDNNQNQSSPGGEKSTVSNGHTNTVAPIAHPPVSKAWVQFEEESDPSKKDSPAVITTESVQVNLERSLSKSTDNSSNNVAVLDPKPLRNVELPVATVEPIRQGFCKYKGVFHQV